MCGRFKTINALTAPMDHFESFGWVVIFVFMLYGYALRELISEFKRRIVIRKNG